MRAAVYLAMDIQIGYFLYCADLGTIKNEWRLVVRNPGLEGTAPSPLSHALILPHTTFGGFVPCLIFLAFLYLWKLAEFKGFRTSGICPVPSELE